MGIFSNNIVPMVWEIIYREISEKFGDGSREGTEKPFKLESLLDY